MFDAELYGWGLEMFFAPVLRLDIRLMLGQNIGIAETVAGIETVFEHARCLLKEDGLLLLNSLDESKTVPPLVAPNVYPGELCFRIQ